MACFKPLVAIREDYKRGKKEYGLKISNGYKESYILNNSKRIEYKASTKADTSVYYPPAQGKNAVRIIGQFDDRYKDSYKILELEDSFLIPCGKCIGCRLDYSRHWADRMMLEYEATKKGCFVTLTYADHDLPDVNPENGEKFNLRSDLNEKGAPISPLIKKHVSEFIKSLRSKFMDNGRKSIRIRFFACGEYGHDAVTGEGTYRPHYHVILFGCNLEDLQLFFGNTIQGDLEPWDVNELGQVSYRSNFLEDVWKERGIVTVSEVSYNTMAYVARYSLKKAQGDDYATRYNLPQEFTLMSRRPGIGAPFLETHQKQFEEVRSWFANGKEIRWPGYLLEKYYSSPGDIEVLENGVLKHYYKGDPTPKLLEIKKERSQSCLDTFMNSYEKDERPYYEKQEFLKRQKEFSVKKLRRGDVALN